MGEIYAAVAVAIIVLAVLYYSAARGGGAEPFHAVPNSKRVRVRYEELWPRAPLASELGCCTARSADGNNLPADYYECSAQILNDWDYAGCPATSACPCIPKYGHTM